MSKQAIHDELHFKLHRRLHFYTFAHVKQTSFFKTTEKAYGGDLLKRRKGRATGRPLSTKDTMHLVLRSTKAKGQWSFRVYKNQVKIKSIIERFAAKYGVRIISIANVGNHLHLHIKLANRFAYRAFIRAVTSAIAMAITGMSRWNKLDVKFWDYRPFTRVVQSFRAYLNLRDYILVNKFEGVGLDREEARYIVRNMNRGYG